MKKFFKLLLIAPGLIVIHVLEASPRAVAEPASPNPSPLAANILDRAYVDIRYGFSLRPPYGAQLSNVPTAAETVTKKQTPAALEQSEMLRLPESKELVRFRRDKSQTTLAVYWMVAKQRNFTIDKMRETREQHWQKFPAQATLQQSLTDSLNGLASAFVCVTWKKPESDTVPLLIQETILQCEPSRFFMLVLTCPVKDKTDRDSADKLRVAVVKNFEYLDKKQQEQRRREARQRGRQWLSALSFNSVKTILNPQHWYRIRRQQEDVGFLRIIEQLETVQEKTVIRIRCDSFVSPTPIAENFIQWRGYAKGLAKQDKQGQDMLEPIRLREEYQLAGDFKTEQFLVTLADLKNSRKNYREQGNWKSGTLTVTRFDDPADAQKSFSETLKINDNLFLPGTLDLLASRLLPLKLTEEYLFLRYANRALRFYSLRIAGRETLTVTTTPSEAAKSDSEPPREQETKIPTTYLIGQVGLDGAIVESWIDKNGRIIKIRTNQGLILLRSNAETIQKLWPQHVKSLATEQHK